MLKKILWITILYYGIGFAQEQPQDSIFWKKSGIITLNFSQSSFSNWIKGGENAIAANGVFNYQFNYKKNKNVWDTQITTAYGLSYISDLLKKTDDRLEINSVYGYQSSKTWYYSAYINFKTQFSTGYDYSVNPHIITSKAFAPAYLNIGPGMLWKKSDNLHVNFAPATSKITLVMDDTLAAAGAYGVDPGKNSRYELGMAINSYYKFELMKNISIENILDLYSNYLKNPQNIDISYQMNWLMRINKYITANLNLHLLYDDDALQEIQFKEIFGLGLNVKL